MEPKKPYSQYTKEECFEFVKNSGCKSPNKLVSFKPGGGSVYDRMMKMNWVKEYPWESYIDRNHNVKDWSKEQCFKYVDESGCKTQSELEEYTDQNNPVKGRTVLMRMRAAGWSKIYPWEIFQDHKNPPAHWSKEQCFEFVKLNGCKKPTDIQKIKPNGNAVYNRLRSTGWAKDYPWESFRDNNDSPAHWSKEQCFEFVKKSGCKTSTELEQYVPKGSGVITRMRKMDWVKDYPWESYRVSTKPTDITAFVKEFLANWDEALHYPNVILMKLAESFGDTSLLNKLVKKIATTDPGSIERKELLEEMNEKVVENDDITCKEIEDIVKMSQEMEDNAVDDPVTAMEKLMNIDDIEDKNGNISTESLGHQVDMAQRVLNNKLIDDKNCGDIVLTIENVFLHRMLCLWADGDDNVTEKMFEKLFV